MLLGFFIRCELTWTFKAKPSTAIGEKIPSHKQTTLLWRRKYTLVIDMLAAMVIAQTSLQQQHINPSWPPILTCDKGGGRVGGAPLTTETHFWVPGHQQALESPRSLGALYSRRGGEKEWRWGSGGRREAQRLKDKVWSRLETCGHWMRRGSRKRSGAFVLKSRASQLLLGFCLSFFPSTER